LEVNSELLSKDASRELEEQFGELVLEDESRKESRQNPDKRGSNIPPSTSFWWEGNVFDPIGPIPKHVEDLIWWDLTGFSIPPL